MHNDINCHQIGKNKTSRIDALKSEILEHAKAIEVLINNNCVLSCNLLTAYVCELGLKYFSFLSNNTKCYGIEQEKYEDKIKSRSLPTGFYKVKKKNDQVEYYQVWQQLNKADKIKLLDGISEKKIHDRTKDIDIEIKTFLCDVFMREEIVSHDYLCAIFKNYSPYPQTHKIIDIFKTLGDNYQQSLYNSFILNLSDYRQKFNLDNNLKLSFENFMDILNNFPSFVTFRYLHSGSGYVANQAEYVGPLCKALVELIMSNNNE